MSGTCVLVSGGVESSALLAGSLKRCPPVWPLYVRCGFVWEDAEIHHLRGVLKFLKSPKLKPLTVAGGDTRPLAGGLWAFDRSRVPDARSDDREVRLPARNLFLLAHAAVLCDRRNIRWIMLGTLKGNPFADAQKPFFKGAEKLLSLAVGRKIGISAPLASMTKDSVVRSSDPELMKRTFSCIRPAGLRPCGKCNKCAERKKAFIKTGINS